MSDTRVSHRSTSDSDSIDLRQVFFETWRRKWIVIGATLSVAALFFLLVSQVTPQYTARASVMLDPRSVQVLSSEEVVSDLTLNNAVLDSEAAVLRSNLLLEEVVGKLDPSLREILDPINQEASRLTQMKASIRRVLSQVKTSILGSPQDVETERAVPLDAEQQEMRRLVGSLRRSLQIWREGQSYLISIGAETRNPVLSATIANTVAETYIQSQVDTRTTAVRGATSFLEDRVATLRRAVEDAEAAVEDFRINQLEQSGLSQNSVEQQLLDLSTQLASARADLSQAQARHDQIEEVMEADGFEAAADLLTSPFVVSLRQQLSELNREDADLATRVGPDHPDRRRVAAQIELVSEDLRSEVRKLVAILRNDVAVARSRTESIQESLSEMESRSANMSRAGIELRQLEREADSIRENYRTMLVRLSETRSTEQLQRADARLVERAVVPGAPSAPRTMLMTVFGGAIGFTLGLIAVFVVVMSNTGFRRTAQLEQETGIPVIASLLKGQWGKRPLGMLHHVVNYPYDRISERLRQLRTALTVSLESGTEGHCIMVTSSIASEGKTSTVLALAHLESLSQKKCVVLDLDLRKSHLARSLGYDTTSDLTDVLLRGHPLERGLCNIEEYGFDLLTVSRPNPQLIDQISVNAMKTLLTELKDRYDTVLIDTAPILLVADTLRFARFADYVLLLVRQGSTRRSAVTEAAKRLEEMGSVSIANVMTLMDARSEDDTYGVYENE